MSMPITAICRLAALGMGVLLLVQPPCQRHSLEGQGQEHGRTMPLADMGHVRGSGRAGFVALARGQGG